MSRTEEMSFAQMCAQYFNDEHAAVAFMQEKGILHQQRSCVCGKEMVLDQNRPSARWRCTRKICRKEVPLRAGTWLEGTNLPVRKALLFIRAWSDKLTSCAFCKDNFGMNGKAAVAWKLTMREAAVE
uniref:Uncharacterized protein n=1 Tax=Trichuris muris TaxID=70415 RepID=A0A5S6QQX2_TRIMR